MHRGGQNGGEGYPWEMVRLYLTIVVVWVGWGEGMLKGGDGRGGRGRAGQGTGGRGRAGESEKVERSNQAVAGMEGQEIMDSGESGETADT